MIELPDELPEGVLMMIRSPDGRVLVIKEGTPRDTIKAWMRLRLRDIKEGKVSSRGEKRLKFAMTA